MCGVASSTGLRGILHNSSRSWLRREKIGAIDDPASLDAAPLKRKVATPRVALTTVPRRPGALFEIRATKGGSSLAR
jgi:hypothetical protein